MDERKQLEEWVKGNSIHDDENDICCPDFSCCYEELLSEENIRTKFFEAYERGDYQMIGLFASVFRLKLLENKRYLSYLKSEGINLEDVKRIRSYFLFDDSFKTVH